LFFKEQNMPDLIAIEVNGKHYAVRYPTETPLLYVLRDDLGLTGTKYGCGEGQCGACTVLLNGVAARSCLTPVSAAAKSKIVTIEGLERHGVLTDIQKAFLDEEALQCGYCTPGMIMSATSLLSRTPNPSAEQISMAMNGNVCRCGTYPRILQAVRRAAHAAAKEAE